MRVLVLGAGGPAGVNTCRALDAAGHEVLAWDEKVDHLVWAEPYATPVTDYWVDADVVVAQPDPLVASLVYDRADTRSRFLPKPQTVTLCQDKFETGLAWRRAGLRDDRIHLVDSREHNPQELSFPSWVRARHGAGARHAICARNPVEARHWMLFWVYREQEAQFVVEGFLPGRDYSWCGIFREGKLLVHFARERLEYLYPHLTPEGLTGTPTRAVVTADSTVCGMAREAVFAVDPEPHGVFCVDLREDEDGIPRPTEINAGRFSTTVGLWSIYSDAYWAPSRSNFVALAAELAAGDDSRLEDWRDLPEGLVLSRHIDCGHVFTKSGAAVLTRPAAPGSSVIHYKTLDEGEWNTVYSGFAQRWTQEDR